MNSILVAHIDDACDDSQGWVIEFPSKSSMLHKVRVAQWILCLPTGQEIPSSKIGMD